MFDPEFDHSSDLSDQTNWLKFPIWIHAWVSFVVDGVTSIVLRSIPWCTWSVYPSSLLAVATP